MSKTERIMDFCYKNPILRFLWSLLPPRCTYPGCEKEHMRWTESKFIMMDGPYAGAWTYCCRDCEHKIRQKLFDNGYKTVHLEDGTTDYIPPLKTERP
jgi:hypothetical protein